MSDKYIVRPGGLVEPCDDVLEWGHWFEAASHLPFEAGGRLVAKADLIGGSHVSTVFLGLDHNWGLFGPPVLYETMIFNCDPEQEGQWRYSTIEEARTGHGAVVRWLCGEGERP